MSKMKKMRSEWPVLAIAAVAIAGAGGVNVPGALAADMAPAPIYAKEPVVAPATSWTGFYLGGGIGFRSANLSEQTLSADRPGFSNGNLMDPLTCTFASCGIPQSLDHTAFRFSPYFGYNWQIAPQWLVGIEGDVGFGSKTSTINGVPLPGAGLFSFDNVPTDSFAVKTSWDASARGRVGYLVTPGVLLYTTGGAAWQRIEATSTCGLANGFFNCGLPDTFSGTVTDSTTKLGYTIGGGIETMVSGHWLLRGEFRYSDFGTITNNDVRTRLPSTQLLVTSYNLRLTTETVLAGVAYKF